MKNIKPLIDEVVEEVKNILLQKFNDVDYIDFLDYQNVLDAEQTAFENGVNDDEPILDMNKDDIDKQTIEFLKLRDKR